MSHDGEQFRVLQAMAEVPQIWERGLGSGAMRETPLLISFELKQIHVLTSIHRLQSAVVNPMFLHFALQALSVRCSSHIVQLLGGASGM